MAGTYGTTGNLLTLRNGGFNNQLLTLTYQGQLFNKDSIQVGNGTAGDFGGGAGVIGIKNAATLPTTNPTGGIVLYADGGVLKWRDPSGSIWPLNSSGGGSGTVTTISVVSANGLSGTVANATSTPAITLSTSVTGLLKGNGTAISAATAADLPTGTTSTQGALQLDSTVPSKPTGSTGSAGSTGKSADSGHIHPRYDFNPLDSGLLAWNYDPVVAANSTVLSGAGTVNVLKVHCPVAISVTNIIMQVVTGGATLTSGQCFAGIFQSGSLLGSTADQSVAWASTGTKTMAITGGPVAVAAGDVYVAFFYNGTTGPAMARNASNSSVNAGLAATSARFGTADTGRTTSFPSTLGSIAASSISYWAALS